MAVPIEDIMAAPIEDQIEDHIENHIENHIEEHIEEHIEDHIDDQNEDPIEDPIVPAIEDLIPDPANAQEHPIRRRHERLPQNHAVPIDNFLAPVVLEEPIQAEEPAVPAKKRKTRRGGRNSSK